MLLDVVVTWPLVMVMITACLGLAHAEVALMDGTCSHCGNMTISVLRSRLQYLEETGAPSYIPRSSFSSGPAQKKPTSVNNLGDLRVTVRNTQPSQSPRTPHSSMTLQPVELPRVRADLSCAVPVVTFGAPPEDQMSIAASEGERMSSGDEDSAALPPSGVAALPESDPEMAAMLSRAAASVGLEWNPPPCPEPSRLDDWFLGVARAGSQRSAPSTFLSGSA